MTVPTAHLNVIAAQSSNYGRWIEIEGIPYGYGNFAVGAGFFSGRTSLEQLLGIKSYLIGIPKMLDQQIDTLDGGAQTTGSVTFEFADIDGSIAQLVGAGYQTGFTALSAEITKTATTIPFPSGGGASFSNGGYCYIGSETIKIGTVGATSFTGCTRGMFRSKPQAFGIGLPIGTRPYTMAHRRVWYHQIGLSGQTPQDLSTASDADKLIRFGGLLDNMVVDENGTKFKLTIHTMDEELNRDIFRGLRTFPLTINLYGNDPTVPGGGCTAPGYPGYSVWSGGGGPIGNGANNYIYVTMLKADGTNLYNIGERVLLRIDNEMFLCVAHGNGNLEILRREQMGTFLDYHKIGAVASEVMCVIEYANVLGMQVASKFTSVCPTGIHADHPLALVLAVLTSTGLGTNGNYDVLPEDWGLGIDQSRIAISDIEAAMGEEPTLRFGGVIESPINFIDFMRQLLAFSGYYYYVALGDQFQILRLRPPEPDSQLGVRTIDDSSRIFKAKAKWEANWSGAVREVVFSYAWDILNQKFKMIDIFKLAGGDLYSKGKARTLSYNSKLMYPGHSGIPGEPPFAQFDTHTWLLSRADFYKVRYGRPPPIVHDRLTYRFIDLEVGGLVQVTSPDIPSTATGLLGMVSEFGEVIGKSIDDEAKVVEFTYLMTGWQLGNYRYIAPSAEIDTVTAGGTTADTTATMNMKENSFTTPTGKNGLPQFDLFPCVGDTGNAFAFSIGGASAIDARIWKADLSAFQDIILVSLVSFPDVAIDIQTADASTWDWNLGAGDFITLPAFADTVGNVDATLGEVLTDKYAFGASNTNVLGANTAADVYFPT